MVNTSFKYKISLVPMLKHYFDCQLAKLSIKLFDLVLGLNLLRCLSKAFQNYRSFEIIGKILFFDRFYPFVAIGYILILCPVSPKYLMIENNPIKLL